MFKKVMTGDLVQGKYTYPSWTTGSTYPLNFQDLGEKVLVYYITKTNKKISRSFPKYLDLNSRLLYVLGFLKGEGSTALGKSNYRRLTITNSDPKIMKLVLDELDAHGIFSRAKIIPKSVQLLHFTKRNSEVIAYWSKELDLSKDKFRCYDDPSTTSPYGVCHVYISDVLLRRVIDLIHEHIINMPKPF